MLNEKILKTKEKEVYFLSSHMLKDTNKRISIIVQNHTHLSEISGWELRISLLKSLESSLKKLYYGKTMHGFQKLLYPKKA